jgi:methionyl-tRNA formyltransferase
MIDRIVAFADDYGLPLLLRHLPRGRLAGVVAASIRPQQHAALRELARHQGVALLVQPRRSDANYAEFVAALRNAGPDFAIVNSYSMKLWPELLSLFPRGGINVHGGLLPQYRGANPIQWALIHDEREAGVTMHRLADEIDAGPIVDQRRVPVRFEDTWHDVQARIAQATESLLADVLPAVLEGAPRATAQDEHLARTFPRRRAEDGRFEWSWRVLDIYNLVRALVAPLPGAFVERDGARIVLDRYHSVSEIVALKFADAAQGPLREAGIVLRPLAAPPTNTEVLFAAGGSHCGLRGIDWHERRAQVAAPADAAHVLRAFARTELGLDAA